MGAFSDVLESQVQDAVCSVMKFPREAAGLLLELATGDGSVEPWPWMNGLIRMACDESDPLDPLDFTPFEGGQCDVFYTITATTSADQLFSEGTFDRQKTNSATLTRKGPIRFKQVFESVDPTIGVKLAFPQLYSEFGTPQQGEFGLAQIQADSNRYLDNFQYQLNVTRLDGQPDDCGNQPPYLDDIPVGEPVQGPDVPVTYVNNEGDTVTENYSLTIFAPIIGSGNIVRIPVRLESPDVRIDGGIRIGENPSFEFNFPNRGGGSEIVEGEPGTPADDGSPVIDEPGDNGDGQRIIGLLCTATVIDIDTPATVVDQPGSPTLYVPRLGNVYFRVPAGAGVSGWTNAIELKNSRCYVPCPAGQGAVDYTFTPSPGVNLTVVAVYGTTYVQLQDT